MAVHRRLARLALGAAILVGIAGCGADFGEVTPNGISLTIGSQTGFDNQVVAQVYGQALEAKGYTVDYNTGIGSRKKYLVSLQDGVVDIVPEYAGLLLDSVTPGADDTSLDTIMTALPIGLDPLGLSVLDASTATKSRVFVVTRQFADAHSIVSIRDLEPVASAITIGSSENFESSSYGRRPLEFVYGLSDWTFRSAVDEPTVVEDLLANTIQVADLSTTDTAISEHDLVELKDPADVITAQNLVPVVNTSVVTDDLTSIMNAVTAQLKTQDLAEFSMVDDELASTVAHDWLVKHKFVVEEH
jgi:osmoprotectant transport system substrate-binding protein